MTTPPNNIELEAGRMFITQGEAKLKGFSIVVHIRHPAYPSYPAGWFNDPEVATRFQAKIAANPKQVFELYQLAHESDDDKKLEQLLQELEDEAESEIKAENERARFD